MAGAYGNNVTYTTEVVEVYTTYCPEPTTLTHGDKTYTITKPTTLTITDCPCTISKPVLTTSVVECHNCAPQPKPTYTAPPAPETVPTAGGGDAATRQSA
ncbi:Clock-controlled protein 6 like [Verticillium longisporum]|nr:Clock-controlled protein 6 like [Verticillium longisporum]